MPYNQEKKTAKGHHDGALEKLLEISKRLGESSDLPVVLGVIIDALRDLLDADRATVFTYDKNTNELLIHVAHGVAGSSNAEIRFPATAGIAGACATSREIINIPDAYADDRFNREVDKRTGYRTKSILAIPLVDHSGDLVGVAQVLNTRKGVFDSADEQLGAGIASQAGIALRRAHLIQDHLDKVKLQQEMSVAKEIQESCFPKFLPAHPAFDIAAFSTPAEECGGDAFDVFGMRDGTIANCDEAADKVFFFLGDATGHGVGPALSSMQARGMLRISARLGQKLGPIAREMNTQLNEDLPSGRFVTGWLGILDLATASIECFSAGQGPVYVYRREKDHFEEIDSDAPPFGILMPGFSYEETRIVELGAGDMLILITDGY
ncbi:MAG: SpoIIE family protein phosphatase [Planctomycetota bacterium]